MKMVKMIGKVLLAMFLSIYALILILGILFVLGVMYYEAYMFQP
ncbi:hypothetical protein NQ117_15620 [Paenibacillus sp. SC116]|nr:hypothetical protein [Paenibacillus sp. SC116]MCR8845111.1 hypothetical protein [Paenibacillus sp. SC116]